MARNPAPQPPGVTPIDPATDPRGLPSDLTCWEPEADSALQTYVDRMQRYLATLSAACSTVPGTTSTR